LVLRGEAGVGPAVRVKVTDRVHQSHPLNAALRSVQTINIPCSTRSQRVRVIIIQVEQPAGPFGELSLWSPILKGLGRPTERGKREGSI
ncbi:uncharacterized, partial [Tachysurus ichikawai]